MDSNLPHQSILSDKDTQNPTYVFENGLRKVVPYQFVYTTTAKGRWLGRTILNVMRTEFHDKSPSYYKVAIEQGWITINGKIVNVDYVIRNGDKVAHSTHRHEPPVTSDPVTFTKDNDLLIVNKPASIPVHPTGRYRCNTILEIIKYDHPNVCPKDSQGNLILYSCNRLDRLTSGLVFVALSTERARIMETCMKEREVEKEYVCRVKGEFPLGEIICTEPMITISHKLGLNATSPDGKPSETRFQRISYNGFTSVVLCKPVTGRTHQIRVHLQYLGHPIANDPLYENSIWEKFKGSSPGTAEAAKKVVEECMKEAQLQHFTEKDVTRCTDCAFPKPDYKPWELCIWLHAFKYSGPGWSYQVPLPDWADENYTQDKEIVSWLMNRTLGDNEN